MSNTKPLRYIILDSCIIQHFSIRELAESILILLGEAVAQGYGVSISDYTFFELVDGSSIEKENERINVIGTIKRFWVRKDVLIAGAHLGCLYKEDGVPEGQINNGDKIIGATSVLTNSIIFTTNSRDFPTPFFRIIGSQELKYNRNGKPITIMSSYIEPNIEYIVSKYNERVGL